MSRPPVQWTPTAHCFAQHLFSQVTNFWRQGREASFHLKSLNNGQAEMSLAFRLPHPSEIIPPPSPYPVPPFPTSNSTRPAAPTPPKRPIIPLFPPGQAPKLKQRKSPVKQPAPQAPAPPAPAQATQATPSHSHRRAVLLGASQATPSLPPALPGTLRWQCAGLLQRAIAAATCPQPSAPHLQQHSRSPQLYSPSSTSVIREASSLPFPRNFVPQAPSREPQGNPPAQLPGLPNSEPHPCPLPKRDDLPSSPTLNLTPVPFPQPQPPALLRAPTLDLTPSPLPEDPDYKGEEEEKSKEEKSNVDCDVVSDVEEEEKSKKEERSKDWADQVEEEKRSSEGELSTEEEVERERRKVVATRKWQELKPRTARTVRAMKPMVDRADLFLSFEPGALITGIRPASWVQSWMEDDRLCWLEGTLEGRVGLVQEGLVEYLPASSPP